MAYLTKGPLGYYVNRQFVLPTPVGDAIVGTAARGRMGYYTGRNFILPTSSTVRNLQIAAAAQSAKKSCSCGGSCGHCGGKQYRRPGLGRLGDDGDFIDPDTGLPLAGEVPQETATFLPSGSSATDTGLFDVENFPNVNFSSSPGSTQSPFTNTTTSSIASAVGNVFSSLFAPKATTGLTPAQQQALALQQQNSLTAPVAGIGLSPLTLAGIAVATVVVISLVKSGKRR